ncbi:hypothetical protein R6Q59_025053 [Mikania micrantha]
MVRMYRFVTSQRFAGRVRGLLVLEHQVRLGPGGSAGEMLQQVSVGLRITSTNFSESDEDHGEDDVEALGVFETQSRHTKSQKNQKTNVRPHFIPPMYMNRVVNQVKLRQAVGSNVSQKVPLTKDNIGEKIKLVLVDDDYDDEDDESFQVDDDDVQDDESEEMGDMIQSNIGTCKRKRITMVTSTVSNERIGDLVHDDYVEDNHVFETQLQHTRTFDQLQLYIYTKAKDYQFFTQQPRVQFFVILLFCLPLTK